MTAQICTPTEKRMEGEGGRMEERERERVS